MRPDRVLPEPQRSFTLGDVVSQRRVCLSRNKPRLDDTIVGGGRCRSLACETTSPNVKLPLRLEKPDARSRREEPQHRHPLSPAAPSICARATSAGPCRCPAGAEAGVPHPHPLPPKEMQGRHCGQRPRGPRRGKPGGQWRGGTTRAAACATPPTPLPLVAGREATSPEETEKPLFPTPRARAHRATGTPGCQCALARRADAPADPAPHSRRGAPRSAGGSDTRRSEACRARRPFLPAP